MGLFAHEQRQTSPDAPLRILCRIERLDDGDGDDGDDGDIDGIDGIDDIDDIGQTPRALACHGELRPRA